MEAIMLLPRRTISSFVKPTGLCAPGLTKSVHADDCCLMVLVEKASLISQIRGHSHEFSRVPPSELLLRKALQCS